jgi:D-alanyl-D-alanine carboxypeptidase/D-alanyl-D-alanine-endopeptidase (penicillin-binding protein 4)
MDRTLTCHAPEAVAKQPAGETPGNRPPAPGSCPSEATRAPGSIPTRLEKALDRLVGRKDAVLLADPSGRVLVSKNSHSMLAPASTFKLLTCLSAIHTLGCDFRFVTEFYMNPSHDLIIKGYGDPLLISEVLPELAARLAGRIQRFHDLVIDGSYFQHPLVIPGRSSSSQPYDAPNGAFCVNFNTVAFRQVHGTYVSAEAQTPLLPFALKQIKASGLKEGRISFSSVNDENLVYGGELITYFLNGAGIRSTGRIRRGKIDPANDVLLLRYVSAFALDQVVAKLLEYSNNFMANQLFLATGAAVLGAPATLEKAIRVAQRYAAEVLGLGPFPMVEGSGLSRQNRLSAAQMLKIVEAFAPYHELMRHEGRQYYKTGTLSDIRNRVGYIEIHPGCLFRFVVFVNTPGKDTDKIMQVLEKAVAVAEGD